jgi:hypothetical protein
MQSMIEVTNNIESPSTEFPPETTESNDELGDEIANLWSAHVNAKNAARATNEELRALRAKLGEQLCRVKEVLAKPGCDGQWSGFLRERRIPRATADRLVARHLRSLNPNINSITEATPEPTEKEVQKLFISLWPKLRRTLRSRQSLLLFIDLLKSQYECTEAKDREIFVHAPSTPTIPSR